MEMVTEVKPLLLKALEPIKVTELGMSIDVKLLQYQKA